MQLDQLEYVFENVSQYPDVFVREELSKRLGIKEDRIQVRGKNWILYSFSAIKLCAGLVPEQESSVSEARAYWKQKLQKPLQSP